MKSRALGAAASRVMVDKAAAGLRTLKPLLDLAGTGCEGLRVCAQAPGLSQQLRTKAPHRVCFKVACKRRSFILTKSAGGEFQGFAQILIARDIVFDRGQGAHAQTGKIIQFQLEHQAGGGAVL